MSDEIDALPPQPAAGGISIGSLYGEVSLRHDKLDRDAAAVKATAAGMAQQMGSLSGVPVGSELGAQFRQVAAVLAPVLAGVSALGTSLGGLTLDASGISGGADKAVLALGRVQQAAERSPAIRFPGMKAAAGALTQAQKNALSVEQARIGGDAGGRLQVARDRALDEMKARGASAAQIAAAKSGYDARIAAIQASDASRASTARQHRELSGERQLAGIDTALQGRVASLSTSGGSPIAILAERQNKLQAQYGAAMERIDRASAAVPNGAANPGIVQAKALAANALDFGRDAANTSFVRATDGRNLQAVGASLDELKAKRNAFLSGLRSNGEDARRYVADLSGLYSQASNAAVATPAQMAEQARLLKEIGGAAKEATDQTREVPAAVSEAQAAIGDGFGAAVERSLAESQAGAGYESERRRYSQSFSQSMRRNWRFEMERVFDVEVGRTAQRGVSRLFGDLFSTASGKESRSGKSIGAGADGSKSKPFYTVPTGLPNSGGAQSGGTGQQSSGLLQPSGSGGEGAEGGSNSPGGSGSDSEMSGLAAGASDAVPWIAASLAISKALGGRKTFAGRLFNGGLFGAFFKNSPLHFAVGGAVPDEGGGKNGGDTVPAMLTPGEFVLSRPMLAQIAEMSGRSYGGDSSGMSAAPSSQSSGWNSGRGGVNVTVHQHGDNHFHTDADMDEFSQRQAWGIKNQLQTSAPGLF